MLEFMPSLLPLVHHAVAEVRKGILALVCVPVHTIIGLPGVRPLHLHAWSHA
jgi:hypothetical protein